MGLTQREFTKKNEWKEINQAMILAQGLILNKRQKTE